MGSEPNPFEPQFEDAPLRLTFDAAGLSNLSNEEQSQLDFLVELCSTPMADAQWSWGGNPAPPGIPELTLCSIDQADSRLVKKSSDEGFSTIQDWSLHEQSAESFGLENEDRERYLYYSALEEFHRVDRRLLLVTQDARKLAEARSSTNPGTITSVGGALYLMGLAMKLRNRVIWEARQGHNSLTRSGAELWLSTDLLTCRRRLFDGARFLGEDREEFANSLREDLARALFDRVGDLVHAADEIGLASLKADRKRALAECLYHLRAAIGTSAGAFDNFAVLASEVLQLQLPVHKLSLKEPDFRLALRSDGARNLAGCAGNISPLLKTVWAFRNPALHREGVSGYLLHEVGRPKGSSLRIPIGENQAFWLTKLCQARGETPTEWGLDGKLGMGPNIELQAFASKFGQATIEALDQLGNAFADDRKATDHETTRTEEDAKKLRRLRWLSGMPPRQGLVYFLG